METQKLLNKIYALQKTIDAFKKYDKERKQYYSKVLIRLGVTESELEELKDSLDAGLLNTIKIQKQRIRSLEVLLKMQNNQTDEDVATLKAKLDEYALQNKHLREANAKLIYKLNNENKDNSSVCQYTKTSRF